jgi:hypothetical protein
MRAYCTGGPAAQEMHAYAEDLISRRRTDGGCCPAQQVGNVVALRAHLDHVALRRGRLARPTSLGSRRNVAHLAANLRAHRVAAHLATLGSVTAFCAGGHIGRGGRHRRNVSEPGATGGAFSHPRHCAQRRLPCIERLNWLPAGLCNGLLRRWPYWSWWAPPANVSEPGATGGAFSRPRHCAQRRLPCIERLNWLPGAFGFCRFCRCHVGRKS